MIPNIWLATLHRNARQTEPRVTQAASNWFDLFVPEASWLDSFSGWLEHLEQCVDAVHGYAEERRQAEKWLKCLFLIFSTGIESFGNVLIKIQYKILIIKIIFLLRMYPLSSPTGGPISFKRCTNIITHTASKYTVTHIMRLGLHLKVELANVMM